MHAATLPRKQPGVVLPWITGRMKSALNEFGCFILVRKTAFKLMLFIVCESINCPQNPAGFILLPFPLLLIIIINNNSSVNPSSVTFLPQYSRSGNLPWIGPCSSIRQAMGIAWIVWWELLTVKCCKVKQLIENVTLGRNPRVTSALSGLQFIHWLWCQVSTLLVFACVFWFWNLFPPFQGFFCCDPKEWPLYIGQDWSNWSTTSS